jgi:hypothetical protein
MSDAKPQNPFVIDTERLDLEWARQPKLSRDSGAGEADARHEYNQAKTRLAVIEAQLAATRASIYLEIRSDPTKYDLREKPTVDEVEAAVLCSKGYQAGLAAVHGASAAVNDAHHALDLAEANRIAITHDRRKALENYVQLLAINYVCEREPKPLSEAAQQTLRSRERRSAFGTGIDDNDRTSD